MNCNFKWRKRELRPYKLDLISVKEAKGARGRATAAGVKD
jgi:hypothetical protein